MRLLCADRHPDHDSICTFRRENRTLLKSGFHQVLEVAARLRVLRVGEVTLALDGTKILAKASRFDKLSSSPARRPPLFPLGLLGGEPRPCAQANGAVGGATRP